MKTNFGLLFERPLKTGFIVFHKFHMTKSERFLLYDIVKWDLILKNKHGLNKNIH